MSTTDDTFDGGSSASPSTSIFDASRLDGWMSVLSKASLDELVLVSRSRNGFQREAALRHLMRSGNPAALPVFLERLNDWVPNIRRVAHEAIEGLMRDEHAATWINSVPTVLRLREQRRADHSAIVARALQLVLRPRHVDLMLEAIESKDVQIARAAARLCIEHALAEPAILIERLIRQPDVVARDLAAGLLRTIEGEAFESAATRLVGDSHMSVRREALQLLLLRRPAVGLQHAREGLFDSGSWIRSISQRALKDHAIDTLPLLLTALVPSVPLRRQQAALYGLADAHREIAPQHLLPYIGHPQPSLRRSALQALARCNTDLARPLLLLGLCDESPSVVATCGRLLRTVSPAPSLVELDDAMRKSRCERTFDACFSISRAMNKWDRLILLLTVREKALAEGRELRAVNDAMLDWNSNFNRHQATCTPWQRARISVLLSDTSLGLPQQFVAMVRFSL